jgi:hypothetical protein
LSDKACHNYTKGGFRHGVTQYSTATNYNPL